MEELHFLNNTLPKKKKKKHFEHHIINIMIIFTKKNVNCENLVTQI